VELWDYGDDLREGVSKEYYDTGQLMEEVFFKNDKKDGLSNVFFKNGKVRHVDMYKDGTRVSRKAYDQRGMLEFD